MKIIDAIRKSFEYSIFDELVDRGAERLERFPDDVLWLDTPALVWIGDYSIENDSLVGAMDDTIVIGSRHRRYTVAINIRELKREYGSGESEWSKADRPFSLRGLRVSFGERGNRHVAEMSYQS